MISHYIYVSTPCSHPEVADVVFLKTVPANIGPDKRLFSTKKY